MAGFLLYLRSLVPGAKNDTQLFHLACAPLSLSEMRRAEVSPLPAENFAISVHHATNTNHTVECWPKLRDFEPNRWAVLVSQEIIVDPKVAMRKRYWREAVVLKYAFVRPQVHIAVENPPAAFGLAVIEVCDLAAFLQATAPETDLALVDRELKKLVKYISRIPSQARLPPGVEWLSVLEQGEAAAMFKDFLEDGEFVKNNLRLAMLRRAVEGYRDGKPFLL